MVTYLFIVTGRRQFGRTGNGKEMRVKKRKVLAGLGLWVGRVRMWNFLESGSVFPEATMKVNKFM